MSFVGLTYVPIVCAQLQNTHTNPGANRNTPTWMQRHLGQISFLERLQDGLQFGAGLLEASQHGGGTAIQEFLHGCLPGLTGFCLRIGTPGQCGLAAAARRNHLCIKITPCRQMGHCISSYPARTIGRAAPVALWPASKRLYHASRLVGNDRNIGELFTSIESHISSPSLYTNTAASTSKTVGCCTGVHKAWIVCSTNFRRQAYSSAWGFSGAPKGWWNRPPRTIRLAPTRVATVYRQVANTVGIPARSHSLAIVAPLRVPVPHVAGNTTAWTPRCTSVAAISAPIRFMAFKLPILPTVTNTSSSNCPMTPSRSSSRRASRGTTRFGSCNAAALS